MKIKPNNQIIVTTSLVLALVGALAFGFFIIYMSVNRSPAATVTTEKEQVMEEPEMDSFENETEGYKFDYPKGWKTELRQGEVFLESTLGLIIVIFKDHELKLGYETKDIVSISELEEIGEKIKNSFELTDSKSFDKDYIRQRYLETEASESANN